MKKTSLKPDKYMYQNSRLGANLCRRCYNFYIVPKAPRANYLILQNHNIQDQAKQINPCRKTKVSEYDQEKPYHTL